VTHQLRAAHAIVRETGQRCSDCGAFHFPPRTLCRICAGRRLILAPLSGRGVVQALRALQASLSPLRRACWVPAWVELQEGALVRAELRPEEAIVGLPVELVPREERRQMARVSLGFLFRAVQTTPVRPVHAAQFRAAHPLPGSQPWPRPLAADTTR
jgi:uncharacterized OB-fold protein